MGPTFVNFTRKRHQTQNNVCLVTNLLATIGDYLNFKLGVLNVSPPGKSATLLNAPTQFLDDNYYVLFLFVLSIPTHAPLIFPSWLFKLSPNHALPRGVHSCLISRAIKAFASFYSSLKLQSPPFYLSNLFLSLISLALAGDLKLVKQILDWKIDRDVITCGVVLVLQMLALRSHVVGG